ncbi:MAG: 30S ribosomal protein S4e [Candidatus Aenigmatarchaeota archaeon]|nr:MAG: 30S ribosomal protein S4e [Candidatus Aenigmarchaeota archaeon]
MAHMKRYTIPKFWPVSKKENKFIVTPRPGPHPKHRSIPLKIIIRDILKYAENSREVKKILNEGKIMVDKKVRKEPGFPVGLMDVIEIPDTHEHFRVTVNSKGLTLEKISKTEAGVKLCRIQGKTTVKGGLTQLNLHDGRNILTKSKSYKVGDSVLISLPDQKILKHFSLAKGADAMIIAGRNVGVKGKIKDIQERKTMLERSIVTIESKNKEIKTLKDYVMVGKIEVSK